MREHVVLERAAPTNLVLEMEDLRDLSVRQKGYLQRPFFHDGQSRDVDARRSKFEGLDGSTEVCHRVNLCRCLPCQGKRVVGQIEYGLED